MKELIKDVGEWSEITFGTEDRTKEIFNHLKEEADEAISYHEQKSPFMDWAFADCFILLFDSMHRLGITWDDVSIAIKSKMIVNKKKDWSYVIEEESASNNNREV